MQGWQGGQVVGLTDRGQVLWTGNRVMRVACGALRVLALASEGVTGFG